jgi:GTP-binding protein
MVETYLAGRSCLACVVLIVDVRRTPAEEDRLMLQWLRAYDIPVLVVITKCDKVSKNERAKQAALISRTLGLSPEEMAFFSALSREGRDVIWARIEAILAEGDSPAGEDGP